MPLISVNLPTYNGAETIKDALESVKAQTYKNYEIVIVDHYSKDETIEIAKKYTKKIYFDKRRLLSSREIGLRESKGEVILFLSCDQVLEPTALERIAKIFAEQDVDMVITEERSYKPNTFIAKMTDIDRKLIQQDYELNPMKSVLLPSAFRKSLLVQVFKEFNDKYYETVTIHDHAIIYYESYKLSKKIGLINNFYFHQEPKSTKELFSHYVSWGRRGREVEGVLSQEHKDMFASKMKYRLKKIEIFNKDSLKRLPIIFIKGLGYNIGQRLPKKK